MTNKINKTSTEVCPKCGSKDIYIHDEWDGDIHYETPTCKECGGNDMKNKVIRIELKEDIDWKDMKYLCTKLSKINGYNFDIHPSFNNILVRSKGFEREINPSQQGHDSSLVNCASIPTKLQEDNLPSEINIVENE